MEEIKILETKPGDDLHTQCLNLRHEVLRVPLGRSLFTEDLSAEIDNIFLVAVNKTESNLDSQKVIGCILIANYTEDSTSMTHKLRHMAVSPDYQGKGIGALLVQKAEEISRESGKKRIYLHGRKYAAGFYQKMGYKIISEEFLESGIPHLAMEKIL